MVETGRLTHGTYRVDGRSDGHRYTMSELVAESGVSSRTIRYYIAEGLLQPAYGRGPSAVYDTDHLLRLKYVQLLKDERLPLGEIKDRLNALTPEDIAIALDVTTEPEAETWRHIRLHDDLSILIRDQPTGYRDARREQAFALIVEYARSVVADLRRDEDES